MKYELGQNQGNLCSIILIFAPTFPVSEGTKISVHKFHYFHWRLVELRGWRGVRQMPENTADREDLDYLY